MNKLFFAVLFSCLVGCKENLQSPTLKPGITVKKIVVYDFWAPWCPPCRAFSPTFDSWKKKYGDNVTFVKVNTDEDTNTAIKFKISALPTIVVTHDDVEVKRWMGAPTESEIVEFFK